MYCGHSGGGSHYQVLINGQIRESIDRDFVALPKSVICKIAQWVLFGCGVKWYGKEQ